MIARKPLHAAIGMSREPPFSAVVNRIVCRPGPASESRALIVLDRALDLGAVVHDERAVLSDGLSDGPTLEKQYFAFVAGFELDRDVAANRGRGTNVDAMICDSK